MATRSTAEERREDVLQAALIEFAAGGLDGTSTDAIARRAGISQPYLFRLFPTKKELFVAAVERTFERVLNAMREAAEGFAGMDAKERMADAYVELLRDETFLKLQLHAYAAACDDADVREATRRGFGRLWDDAIVLTGMSARRVPRVHGDGNAAERRRGHGSRRGLPQGPGRAPARRRNGRLTDSNDQNQPPENPLP